MPPGFLIRAAPGQHHTVQIAELVAVQAEKFARHAFHPVARDGGFYRGLGHREAQTRIPALIAARHDLQGIVPGATGVLEYAPVLFWLIQPAAARVTRARQNVVYALRRLRPLARRALITARPPGVAMRARKPWVRLRLIMLGWNVLFMVALNSG